MKRILAIAASTLALTALATAHEYYRVVGTIVNVSQWEITMNSQDGQTVTMALDRKVQITRDKKTVSRDELHPGLYVIAEGSGDTLESTIVTDVTIVPPPRPKKR